MCAYVPCVAVINPKLTSLLSILSFQFLWVFSYFFINNYKKIKITSPIFTVTRVTPLTQIFPFLSLQSTRFSLGISLKSLCCLSIIHGPVLFCGLSYLIWITRVGKGLDGHWVQWSLVHRQILIGITMLYMVLVFWVPTRNSNQMKSTFCRLPYLSVNCNIKGKIHFSSEYTFLKSSAAGNSSIMLPTAV